MVEADAHIALRHQQFGGGLALVQTLAGAGQVLVLDQLLVGFHPGHVGIAEQGQALGPDGQDLADGVQGIGHGLSGQAIHQVHIDRADPELPQPADAVGDVAEVLHPVDGGLDFRRQVLDAEAGPVEAICGGGLHPVAGQDFRVQLGGDLGLRAEVEGLPQGPEDQVQLIGGQHVGGAAAQMDRVHLHAAGQGGRQHGVLPHQIGHIVPHRLVAVHSPGVAATVPAEP